MSDQVGPIAGIAHADWLEGSGLQELDRQFHVYLQQHDLLGVLEQLRLEDPPTREEHSAIILLLAPHLEAFLVEAMGYQNQMAPYRQQQARYHTIQQFKRDYLLRRIKPRLTRLAAGDFEALSTSLWQYCDKTDWEYALSEWGLQCLSDQNEEALTLLESWCASACLTEEGQLWVNDSVLFAWPQRIDKENLLGESLPLRAREGFDCQEPGLSMVEQQDHAHYCLDCHQKSGDFCSIGFPVKKGDPDQGYREHASGELMLGCPLEEHVGEMHELFAAGHPLAALAAVMVNNPLAALTGHRVCNDCMKSCVYQKQTPVNTPGVESGVLQWALQLPWGVELIDLLMRWNPLRYWQPIESSDQGRRVAVMGMGPAGIAMMHHLLMAGCTVVGFDGASLTPVPSAWCEGPIRDYATICSPLSERPARGFGGVSEYGITARWDKNLLTLLHVLFQRHPRVTLMGSVRFGGTLTVDDFWPLGFEHLCLAVGAGLPKELRIPNSLAIGMRQASDFLMTLQLSSATRDNALGLFQMRLPALVIGGGLTAVDAATEAMAYYLHLIQTVADRYQALMERLGESALRASGHPADWVIIDEWLDHATRFREAKRLAAASGETVDTIAFVNRLGGVGIVYRRGMKVSPAYRRNHEELALCLAAGVQYHECLQPESVMCDEQGHVSGLRCLPVSLNEEGVLSPDGESVELPARCLLTATGAKPNVAYEFEHRGTFEKHRGNYQPYHWRADHYEADRSVGHFKQGDIGMLTSYDHEGRRVSLLGDTHWRYQGTVVQAIASARRALPQVMACLDRLPKHPQGARESTGLDAFQLRVISHDRLSESVSLLTVSCPLISARHAAGQCYRLLPAKTDQVVPTGVAVLGSRMAPDGCLSFLLQGDSPNRQLLQALAVGDSCDIMGPTGAWAHQPDNPEQVLVIGDHLAVAFLRSVSPEWQEAGHRITWLSTITSDELSVYQPHLPALNAYHLTEAVEQLPETTDWEAGAFSAVYVIGDADLIRAVRKARATTWQGAFREQCRWVGAVYGPMQCQLKGVCAQCLQWQVDPDTGQRTKAVYACSWQHQPMDLIDLEHLSERVMHSRPLDHLTQRWFEECVKNKL